MKLKYIAILLATILLATVAAWAVNEWVISQHVVIEVEEAFLTIQVSEGPYVKGDTIRFNGTLKSDTIIFIGANVTLWCNNTYTGYSNLTDDSGAYEIFFPLTTKGTWDFYTNATIT